MTSFKDSFQWWAPNLTGHHPCAIFEIPQSDHVKLLKMIIYIRTPLYTERVIAGTKCEMVVLKQSLKSVIIFSLIYAIFAHFSLIM